MFIIASLHCLIRSWSNDVVCCFLDVGSIQYLYDPHLAASGKQVNQYIDMVQHSHTHTPLKMIRQNYGVCAHLIAHKTKKIKHSKLDNFC